VGEVAFLGLQARPKLRTNCLSDAAAEAEHNAHDHRSDLLNGRAVIALVGNGATCTTYRPGLCIPPQPMLGSVSRLEPILETMGLA
jgi:hypothetical protein